MFICGQVYSLYIELWKWPKDYRTYMKIYTATRSIREVLVQVADKVPPNLLIESLR